MTKGVKITLIVVGILGAGVGLYFLFRKPKGNTSPYTPDNDFPLKKGSGDIGRPIKRVEALQKYLNDTSYWVNNKKYQDNNAKRTPPHFFEGCSPKLVVDGKWGNNTTGCWLKMRYTGDKVQDDKIHQKFYDDYIKKYE